MRDGDPPLDGLVARLWLLFAQCGRRTGRWWQTEVDRAVDHVLVLAPDRNLKLVARSRQMERPADRDELLRHSQGKPPLESLRLNLRLLAEPLGIQQRREPEPECENDDAARR
jgi:hypothetical protein